VGDLVAMLLADEGCAETVCDAVAVICVVCGVRPFAGVETEEEVADLRAECARKAARKLEK